MFYDCLKKAKFPSDWKKAHVVPVHEEIKTVSKKL